MKVDKFHTATSAAPWGPGEYACALHAANMRSSYLSCLHSISRLVSQPRALNVWHHVLLLWQASLRGDDCHLHVHACVMLEVAIPLEYAVYGRYADGTKLIGPCRKQRLPESGHLLLPLHLLLSNLPL